RRQERKVRIERDGIGLSQTLNGLRRKIRARDDQLAGTEVEVCLRFVTLLPGGLNHVSNAVTEGEARRNLPVVLDESAVARVVKQIDGGRRRARTSVRISQQEVGKGVNRLSHGSALHGISTGEREAPESRFVGHAGQQTERAR